MSVTHESMMALTADMPMQEINSNGKVYLQRYLAHMLPDGTQVWYHRFLRNDSEPHLHSHPWEAESKILLGGYSESRQEVGGRVLIIYTYKAGDTNLIQMETVHRIVEVAKDTWTQMIVKPDRTINWHFIEDNGAETEMSTYLCEWHSECKKRGYYA